MFSITIQAKDFSDFREQISKLNQDINYKVSHDQQVQFPVVPDTITASEALDRLTMELPSVNAATPQVHPTDNEPTPTEQVVETKPKRRRKKKETVKVEATQPVTTPQDVASTSQSLPPVQGSDTVSLAQFKQSAPLIIFGLIEEKKIDNDYVKQLCDYFEVSQLMELFAKEDALEQLYSQFVQLGILKGAQ